MSKTNTTQEERQLIKLIEKLHLSDENKTGWAERIRNGEMSEELAEEIRQKLNEHAEGEQANTEQALANRARNQVELTNLVKRWRLSNQSRNFGRK